MEAKEHLTVDDCLKLYDEVGIVGLVETVKEISFKAGIKEVVEWVNTHKLYAGNISIPKRIWQAKLKEWGIEG